MLKFCLRQELARIHDVVRVKLGFDGTHQGDFRRGTDAGEPVFFDNADTVFRRDGTLAGEDVFIDDGVHGIFVAVSVVAQYVGQEGVVMQAAVAQMSEADNFVCRESGFPGRVRIDGQK